MPRGVNHPLRRVRFSGLCPFSHLGPHIFSGAAVSEAGNEDAQALMACQTQLLQPWLSSGSLGACGEVSVFALGQGCCIWGKRQAVGAAEE